MHSIQSRDDLVADLMRCKHSSISFIHCLDFNYKDKVKECALGHDYGLYIYTIMLCNCIISFIQRRCHSHQLEHIFQKYRPSLEPKKNVIVSHHSASCIGITGITAKLVLLRLLDCNLVSLLHPYSIRN